MLLVRPFVLLRFQAPEYEMDDKRGVVRWRIERGVLVARRGRGGDGYLEIDDASASRATSRAWRSAHVEVEVANFYPTIASTFARWVYRFTQSLHPRARHARRSCARWRARPRGVAVGRFAGIDGVPRPVLGDRGRASASARPRAPR